MEMQEEKEERLSEGEEESTEEEESSLDSDATYVEGEAAEARYLVRQRRRYANALQYMETCLPNCDKCRMQFRKLEYDHLFEHVLQWVDQVERRGGMTSYMAFRNACNGEGTHFQRWIQADVILSRFDHLRETIQSETRRSMNYISAEIRKEHETIYTWACMFCVGIWIGYLIGYVIVYML